MTSSSTAKKGVRTPDWEALPQANNSELLLLLRAYGLYVRHNQILEICKVADSTLNALKREKDPSFDPDFPKGRRLTERTTVYSTVELYHWMIRKAGEAQ